MEQSAIWPRKRWKAKWSRVQLSRGRAEKQDGTECNMADDKLESKMEQSGIRQRPSRTRRKLTTKLCAGWNQFPLPIILSIVTEVSVLYLQAAVPSSPIDVAVTVRIFCKCESRPPGLNIRKHGLSKTSRFSIGLNACIVRTTIVGTEQSNQPYTVSQCPRLFSLLRGDFIVYIELLCAKII